MVLTAGYLAGSVPFSNIAARRTRSVDLRHVGEGTVSGTALYRVAGFGPLAVAGVCDVAKGSVGPLLAGPERPGLAALSGGAAVAGHNWSLFLGGAGGRGVSPALGALAVRHWRGSALLLGGLAAGRLVRQSGLGTLLATLVLPAALRRTDGPPGSWAGVAVAVPMLAKRLRANAPPRRRAWRVYLHRLLFDNDGPEA